MTESLIVRGVRDIGGGTRDPFVSEGLVTNERPSDGHAIDGRGLRARRVLESPAVAPLQIRATEPATSWA